MHISNYALILCFLFPTTFVLGQTPPSVTDTIELNFDTIPLPKRGPNFPIYYSSGKKLFGVKFNSVALPIDGRFNVYESVDSGKTWRLKFENLIDFNAHDSLVYYCEYKQGAPISAGSFAGSAGSYNLFASHDNGQSFNLKDSNAVQIFWASRLGCVDDFIQTQRLNDSVLIFGVHKYCEIANQPSGVVNRAYSKISTNNGRTWQYDLNYDKIPNFTLNGTAFRKRDSFMLFTRRADFQYNDSIKLSPIISNSNILGYSFVANVFSVYRHLAFANGLVYSTSDKGRTWRTDTLAFRLAFSSPIVQVKDTVFVLAQNALYRSDNGNFRNFRRVYPQYPNNNTQYSGLSVLSSGIYFNGADKTLLRSTNGGATWQTRNNTEGGIGGNRLQAFGEDIWFNDNGIAVYHFEDNQPVTRLDTFVGFTDFGWDAGFRKDSMYLIATNRATMQRSTDKGLTWLPSIAAFYPKLDSNRIYGVSYSSNAYAISNDNAKNFSFYFTPERLWDIVIKKDKIWAIIGDLIESIRVVRSIDGGRTWVTVFKNTNNPPSRLINEGQTLWLIADRRFYRSTDEGTTWTQMSEDVPIYNPKNVRKKEYIFTYSEISSNDIYVSKNEGITWTRIKNVPNALITDKYIYTSQSVWQSGNTDQLKISRFPIDSLANKIKSAQTYSLLRGQILKDKNDNCRQDTTDAPIPSKMLRFNGGFNTATDQNGRFSIILPIDTYRIQVANEPYYALRCGSDTTAKRVIVRPNLITDTVLLFQKTQIAHDISLTLTANGRPRAGNEVQLVLSLKNTGTATVDSVRVQFDFTNVHLRLVSASPNAVVSGQKLTWLRRNLSSDAEELLKVNLKIDTSAPLSTELRFYAQADILTKTDIFPSDNRDSLRLIVVGSYDPNDKTVLPDGKIPISDKLNSFDYLIRFQNTGTDTAYKVVIVDTLPALLDVHTLRVKAASHPYQLKVDKNVLTFIFDRIMLPDSFVNERASHGFIRYTINPKKPLVAGENLDNRAHIFFDYNAPIVTNTAQNNVYKPTIQTQKTVTLCAGDRWQGIVYTRSTVLVDTVIKSLIDTINTTFLDVKPTYYRQIDTTLRYGDTLFGQRMEVNQRFIFARRTAFGCDSTTVYNVVVVRPSANSDLADSKINITLSPNPTNDWLSINYHLDKAVETEIYWVNALGQKIGILKKKAFDTEGGHTLQLDMRGFAAGMYQVILQTPIGRKTVIFSKI